MKKILLILSLMTIQMMAHAQEWLGIVNSNYAGVTSVFFNPSLMVNSRLKWDGQIIGADIFLENNAVYYPKIYKIGSNETINDTVKKYGLKDYYTPNPSKSVYQNLVLKLPSAMFRIKKHTFAIQFGYRENLSVHNLDYRLAKIAYEDRHFRYSPLYFRNISTAPFDIAMMAMAEVAVSYGYPFISTQKHFLAGAVTLKREFANMGVYLNSNALDFSLSPSIAGDHSDLNSTNVDLEMGYSLSGGGSTFTGGGFGFDIGGSYERRKGPGEFVPYHKRSNIKLYKYKISAAVIDIGQVSFNTNAGILNVKQPVPSTWNGIDSTKFSGLTKGGFDNLASTMSTNFYGNPTIGVVDAGFAIGLPMAATMQYDHNLNDRFYISAAMVQGIPMTTPSIRRPSQLAVIPRYETKYFEVSMPYSLYNYDIHRLGLGLRFGPFIVGTDKLGSFLGLNDFTGLDFYFAIKLSGYLEDPKGMDPFRCFYKFLFKKFQFKKGAPKGPVLKF